MPPENALTDIRAEWAVESTPGVYASDPSWNAFADYFTSYPGWSGDPGVEGQEVIGSGDISDHFRGSEEHSLSLTYWLQRFWVDSNGNIQDPGGVPLTHDYQTDYETHTVSIRREAAQGGNDGAGLREYVVGVGCRPVGVDLPGDPAESQPLAQELTYECEKVRQYVIHQPASGTTVDVVSTSSNDTMSITIEDEGAGTTESIALNGTTAVTTTASFSDIDAAFLGAEPQGTVTVTDGSGTTLLEIPGSDSTNIDGDRGVPPLGAGSHAGDIGTDPDDYLFLGTSSSFGGGSIAQSPDGDRVHAFDFSAEVATTTEPQQASGRPAIDVGTRTVEVDATVAGPYESAAQNREFFANNSADIVYSLPGGDLTVKNATRVDTDDVDRSAGDENLLYGVTFEGHGDPAVTLSAN